MESIALEAGSGAFGPLRFWPTQSESNRPLILWIEAQGSGCSVWPAAQVESALANLRAQGMACALLESVATCPDRDGIASIEAALSLLADKKQVDAERMCVVGVGRGGTLAFLSACTSMQVGALALIDAALIYAELSAEYPVQPLEMALNLSAPTLILTSSNAPGDVQERRAEELSFSKRALSQFARPFDSFEFGPAPGSDLLADDERGQVAVADEIVQHLLSFLEREWCEADGS